MGIKAEDKKYFKSINREICYSLLFYIREAKEQGLKEITLIEANEVKINGVIWCKVFEGTGEKSECNKKQCELYYSKSGRGVCLHRGKLYEHGEEVTFKVD